MKGHAIPSEVTTIICRTATAFVLSAAAWAVAFSAAATEIDELQRTWERAEIWIYPKGVGFCNGRLGDLEIQRALASLRPGYKMPTVIYLHGCGHKKPAGWTYARWLVNAGYAVIMPDSFQRIHRPQTCNPWTQKRLAGAPSDEVLAMRQAEIRYAVAQVQKLPWVDQDNLFLMGHDEGGEAVAMYGGGEFKAYVISGALCYRGFNIPPSKPVLAVSSASDPLFEGAAADSCARHATANGNPTLSKVLPGYLHDVSGEPEARNIVLDFLARLTGAQ